MNQRAVTARSVAVGALLAFTIGAGTPYAALGLRSAWIATDFFNPGVGFLFFATVLLLHTGLQLLRPSLGFRPGELVVIYTMVLVASPVPDHVAQCVVILGGFTYYANPDNGWATLVHPHVPAWIAPRGQAVVQLFEGLPQDAPFPWEAWRRSLLPWLALILVLHLSTVFMMVILRRQWIANERLPFPLVRLPHAMVEQDEGGGLLAPFFRSPVMWAGFVPPFIIESLGKLHVYDSSVPTLNLSTSIPLFRGSTDLVIALSFPMVGFSYFVNLDIALGIWVFNLVGRVEEGVFGILGLDFTETLYYMPPSPVLSHQGMGALLVLVLLGFWTGRHHLCRVFAHFAGRAAGGDEDEIVSYRVAVIGLAGCVAFAGVWLWMAGMTPWVVAAYLAGMYLILIGVTRVVCQGGVAAIRAPIIPPDLVASSVGSRVLSTSSLTVLGLSNCWLTGMRNLVMVSAGAGLKLAEDFLPRRKRGLFWAMLLALIISIAGSTWMMLYIPYTYGGINLNDWLFGPSGAPVLPFKFVTRELFEPDGPDIAGWVSTTIGGGVMGLLMLARQQIFWWPLHPLGFVISTSSLTNGISFSVFLAWLAKTVVLRYGGVALFRKSCPFFLGMIAGQFVAVGLWLFVNYFIEPGSRG